MRKQKRWRVRVRKSEEQWIEVLADTPLQAEQIAITIPFVLNVFGGSAMRAERPADGLPSVDMAQDDLEDWQ